MPLNSEKIKILNTENLKFSIKRLGQRNDGVCGRNANKIATLVHSRW
jgi:hypothetical protein